jgi:hypothetical protein
MLKPAVLNFVLDKVFLLGSQRDFHNLRLDLDLSGVNE